MTAALSGPTERLAMFAAGLRFADIPRDVVHQAKLSLLDTVGVILSASTLGEAGDIVRNATRFDNSTACTILGMDRRAAPTVAALVNGTFSDILEWQDGWRLGGIHPCLVIPTALAMAEWRGTTGADLLTAIVAGYEVANRVAWSVHPYHMARGYMPNGTAGSCGAAASAAHVLAANSGEMLNALGIAGFLLPVSTAENLWGGYTAKPLHTGYAARIGVEAAFLAQDGFTGCPLEGTPGRGSGFLEIMTGRNADFSRFTDGLGVHFTIRDLYFKAFPICRQAHGTAEAALAIASCVKLLPTEISTVTVTTYGLAATMLDRQVTADSTMTAAQFSIPYIAAASLVDGDFSTVQLQKDRRNDPELLALSRRVRVVEDADFTQRYPERTPTRVEVITYDGRHFRQEIDMPKGDPRNPISEAETIEKFDRLAGPVIGRAVASELRTQLLDIENLSDIRALRFLFQPMLGAERLPPATYPSDKGIGVR